MKTIILFLVTLFFLLQANAQAVGVNTNNPDPSAALDINSNNQGLLIPRVSLQSLTDNSTINLPATSLLLYNINNAVTPGNGFYFNNGTPAAPSWKKIISSVDASVAFASRGNATVVQPNINYVLPQNTEDFDVSNNFVVAGAWLFSSSFIAPVNGIYHFEGSVTRTISGNLAFYAYTEIRVNDVNNISVYDFKDADFTSHISNNIQLNAGDKVTLGCTQNTGGPRSIYGSYFTGNLLVML